MNKLVIGAAGLAVVAAVGLTGCSISAEPEAAEHADGLCAETQSDAAEAARAQNLALVDVVEEGRLVSKGTDASVQTFKVRTLAVYKGQLPAEAEIGLPTDAAGKLQVGGRYEVSVTGPDAGTWLARFTRPVPAGKTTEALAAHWKSEIGKNFVKPPCTDFTTAP
ncbi:hypothetical protein [Streptomyces sp. NPDC004330]|uniref:hypothetical protein n=1 Tax=Streptomyces sp. NPDC004330 TaxID=3364700 RepID=UPI0036B97D0B